MLVKGKLTISAWGGKGRKGSSRIRLVTGERDGRGTGWELGAFLAAVDVLQVLTFSMDMIRQPVR